MFIIQLLALLPAIACYLMGNSRLQRVAAELEKHKARNATLQCDPRWIDAIRHVRRTCIAGVVVAGVLSVLAGLMQPALLLIALPMLAGPFVAAAFSLEIVRMHMQSPDPDPNPAATGHLVFGIALILLVLLGGLAAVQMEVH